MRTIFCSFLAVFSLYLSLPFSLGSFTSERKQFLSYCMTSTKTKKTFWTMSPEHTAPDSRERRRRTRQEQSFSCCVFHGLAIPFIVCYFEGRKLRSSFSLTPRRPQIYQREGVPQQRQLQTEYIRLPVRCPKAKMLYISHSLACSRCSHCRSFQIQSGLPKSHVHCVHILFTGSGRVQKSGTFRTAKCATCPVHAKHYKRKRTPRASKRDRAERERENRNIKQFSFLLSRRMRMWYGYLSAAHNTASLIMVVKIVQQRRGHTILLRLARTSPSMQYTQHTGNSLKVLFIALRIQCRLRISMLFLNTRWSRIQLSAWFDL